MRDTAVVMPRFEIGICDLFLCVISAPSAQAAKDGFAQARGWKNEAAMAAANGGSALLWAIEIPVFE